MLCVFALPLKRQCILSYSNQVIMKEWLCFDLAKHCVNSYFEQTQWQQPADAKRYLSSIIYVFHSLSSSRSPRSTQKHTLNTSHMAVHKHTHTATDARSFQGGASQNTHKIAFSIRQKLAKENGSFCHFVSVFQLRMKHDSCWDRWSHSLPEVIHLLVRSKALADLMGTDIMRGTGSSCLLRVKSSNHPNYHLQQHPPRGAAPHHFQPSDPRESTPDLTLHNSDWCSHWKRRKQLLLLRATFV